MRTTGVRDQSPIYVTALLLILTPGVLTAQDDAVPEIDPDRPISLRTRRKSPRCGWNRAYEPQWHTSSPSSPNHNAI